MIDNISSLVCQQLNDPNNGWTWATYPSNDRPWGRIFKTSWLEYRDAGKLVRATRNGVPARGFYPIVWFELVFLDTLEIHVPIDTKGFRRRARCDSYMTFLQSAIDHSNGRWPQFANACSQYLQDIDCERIEVERVKVQGKNNAEKAIFVSDYIIDRYPLIDDTFAAL